MEGVQKKSFVGIEQFRIEGLRNEFLKPSILKTGFAELTEMAISKPEPPMTHSMWSTYTQQMNRTF
ncbi:hypothetical protein SBDP2_1630001 [Syntrophobacter sp. SbD2]|nr:hypothetical protein SBDP2_1630001 [Syntrophobacter sp. SbD2]